MNPDDLKLIVLAFSAIAVLVLLVTWLKLNAFVSLLIASLVVGAGAVLMGRTSGNAPYTMLGVAKSIQDGIGGTLGGIAAVLGLGTMLGKLLAESGGAEVLAKRFAAFFGPKHIQWCIIALALAVGLTTWFAVGLIAATDPADADSRDEATFPVAGAAVAFVPFGDARPDATASRAGGRRGDAQGQHGAGPALGFCGGHSHGHGGRPPVCQMGRATGGSPPPTIATPDASDSTLRRPAFGLTLFSILLPVLLMLLATLAELTLPPNHAVRTAALFIGNPTMALMTSVIFCLWSLGVRCGYTKARLLKFTETSVAAVGMTILVVGGGGGFAACCATAAWRMRSAGAANSCTCRRCCTAG